MLHVDVWVKATELTNATSVPVKGFNLEHITVKTCELLVNSRSNKDDELKRKTFEFTDAIDIDSVVFETWTDSWFEEKKNE